MLHTYKTDKIIYDNTTACRKRGKCTEYIGYYSTNKAADELVNPDLVVPDDVTKGEIVQNVSQDADAQYQKNWTEFKAACD